MSENRYRIGILLLVGTLLISSVGIFPGLEPAPENEADGWPPQGQTLEPAPGFGEIPLYFVANHGQVHEDVSFYARTPGYTLWLTASGWVFDRVEKGPGGSDPLRDVSRLLFPGADPEVEISAEGLTDYRVNEMKGRDETLWKTRIPTSRAVRYRNLYPGIDLEVYGAEREVEYDWIVKPGGRVETIRFQYRDVKGTRIDRRGDLVVETSLGRLAHARPSCYQIIDGSRRDVRGRFLPLGRDTYGFEVGPYDRGRELRIDPVVLLFSTYLGGTDIDYAFHLCVDKNKAVYVIGTCYSDDYPLKATRPFGRAPYLSSIFITKFKKTGKALEYSTYLGGSSYENGLRIAVDKTGAAVFCGNTWSSDFPVVKPYQRNLKGEGDAVIGKLNPKGNALMFCTYLGGAGEETAKGLALDKFGNVYVAGYTDSDNFPTKNAVSGGVRGEDDVFITKFNAKGKKLIYSSVIGGVDSDRAYALAVDGAGQAYIAGRTESLGFPVKNALQPNLAGDYDAFLIKLNKTGDNTLFSTFLGGIDSDIAYDLALDLDADIYLAGRTRSPDFPTQAAVQSVYAGEGDGFVAKIDTAGTGIQFATFLGGTSFDEAQGVAVDKDRRVCVCGNTLSADFPTFAAFQSALRGKGDAFVARFAPGGEDFEFSTLLGGTYSGEEEEAVGIAVDGSGKVYVAGRTASGNFPVKKAFQNRLRGSRNAFVTKLSLKK